MNLDKRQKVIIGLIVIAVLVLAWQVFKLQGGGAGVTPTAASSTTSAASPTAATPAKPTVNYAGAAAAVRTNAVETAAMLSNSATSTTTAANPAAGDGSADASMANDQEKYLELVNEYQMSEIQRMIAEDQASIAQSRFNAAEALSKISQLSGGTANLNDIANPQEATSSDYELIYTGEDNGEWTATVKKNGQFNDVTAGSVLPDGSKVLTVDDNGVLLQEGSNKELVTFNGVTPFDNNGQAASTTPAATSSSPATTPSDSTAAPATNSSSSAAPTESPAVEATPSNTSTANQPAVQPTAKTPNTAAQSTANTVIPVAPKTPVSSSTKPTASNDNKSNVVTASSAPAKPKAVNQAVSAIPLDTVPLKQPNLAVAKVPPLPVPTASNATTSNNASAPTGDNAAFMKEAKNEYTIQIIADNQIGSINHFITENNLQDKASALKTSRNNKPWYIAVYGQYPTSEDADKALAQMPKAIRDQRPFVRRISDVQAKMVD